MREKKDTRADYIVKLIKSFDFFTEISKLASKNRGAPSPEN